MHKSLRGSAVILAATALIITGCSSGAPASEGDAATADVAAAQATLAEFAQPTGFPVTTPLEALPTGARVAYAQCGTPNCALFGDLMEAPAAALGMELTRVDAGQTADEVATAFDSIVAGDYDAVIVSSIQPALWSRYLDQLVADEVPIISTGNSGLDPAKVFLNAGDESLNTYGKVLADWVTVEADGPAEVALYVTPELAPTLTMQRAFEERIAEVNPDAEVRVVEIPVAQFGSTASQIVVDDLLAHPNTEIVAFTLGEMMGGLPSALKAADITGLKSIHAASTPATLEGIAAGEFTAGITTDFGVYIWTLVDAAARAVVGQDVDQAVRDDELVMQVVTAEDLPEDNSKGWSGYPDFAERFAEIRGVQL